MFKKKRNALLEEMREIAENETFRVLESMGLVEMRLLVSGLHGSSTQYSATPTKDRAARALAEDAKAAAEEALEAAGVARADAAMALEREAAEAYRAAKEAEAEVGAAAATVSRKESPCGCRCNNADDTRTSELPSDWDAHVGHEPLQESLHSRLLRDRFVILDCDRDRGTDEQVDRPFVGCDAHDAGATLGLQHFVDPINSVFEIVLRFNVGAPAVVDANCHVSSPVVAESEAATSDAPAMTVQEGGSSDAAPGVEGVSPASSTPRFVVLGELVYDRDANKSVSCINSSAAQSVAAELNANHGNHNRFYWEGAK